MSKAGSSRDARGASDDGGRSAGRVGVAASAFRPGRLPDRHARPARADRLLPRHGHRAEPHDVPVGLVRPPPSAPRSRCCWSRSSVFVVTDYESADALTDGIKRREVYGGRGHLRLSAAALCGERRRAGRRHACCGRRTSASCSSRPRPNSSRLAQQSDRMPVAQAEILNTPPVAIDVVPLPPDDVNGVSLGFLTQALALGGTIASMGLGRLIPRAKRSWRRGIAHVTTLIAYAIGSAAVILLVDELVRRRPAGRPMGDARHLRPDLAGHHRFDGRRGGPLRVARRAGRRALLHARHGDLGSQHPARVPSGLRPARRREPADRRRRAGRTR